MVHMFKKKKKKASGHSVKDDHWIRLQHSQSNSVIWTEVNKKINLNIDRFPENISKEIHTVTSELFKSQNISFYKSFPTRFPRQDLKTIIVMELISCLRNLWVPSCLICDANAGSDPVLDVCLYEVSVYSLLDCARGVSKTRIQIQLLLPPSCSLICASHSWRWGRIRGGGRGREQFSTSPEWGERRLSFPKYSPFPFLLYLPLPVVTLL